jgi:hypothetical protein
MISRTAAKRFRADATPAPRALFLILLLAAAGPAQDAESRAASRPAPRSDSDASMAFINALECDAREPAKVPKPWIRLAEARRRASILGKHWEARVEEVGAELAAKQIVDDAKALEAAGDPRAALGTLDAVLAQSPYRVLSYGRTGSATAAGVYRRLLAASNDLVARFETPEYEAKLKARDLLSPEEGGLWRATAEAGFKLEVGRAPLRSDRPGMTLQGTGDGRMANMGIVSVEPPREAAWTDLIVDLEFTRLAGPFEMYLRYGPESGNYRVRLDKPEGYELNETYRIVVALRGRTATLKRGDQPPESAEVRPGTARGGGIGFGLVAGSTVVISRLDVKVLR